MLIFIEDVNDILIKNLFITNGGYFPVGALDNGGGITCSGSNPIFVDVVISDNSGIFAGGINCWSSNPTFTNVRIINNTSVVSAGVIEIADKFQFNYEKRFYYWQQCIKLVYSCNQ